MKRQLILLGFVVGGDSVKKILVKNMGLNKVAFAIIWFVLLLELALPLWDKFSSDKGGDFFFVSSVETPFHFAAVAVIPVVAIYIIVRQPENRLAAVAMLFCTAMIPVLWSTVLGQPLFSF